MPTLVLLHSLYPCTEIRGRRLVACHTHRVGACRVAERSLRPGAVAWMAHSGETMLDYRAAVNQTELAASIPSGHIGPQTTRDKSAHSSTHSAQVRIRLYCADYKTPPEISSGTVRRQGEFWLEERRHSPKMVGGVPCWLGCEDKTPTQISSAPQMRHDPVVSVSGREEGWYARTRRQQTALAKTACAR